MECWAGYWCGDRRCSDCEAGCCRGRRDSRCAWPGDSGRHSGRHSGGRCRLHGWRGRCSRPCCCRFFCRRCCRRFCRTVGRWGGGGRGGGCSRRVRGRVCRRIRRDGCNWRRRLACCCRFVGRRFAGRQFAGGRRRDRLGCSSGFSGSGCGHLSCGHNRLRHSRLIECRRRCCQLRSRREFGGCWLSGRDNLGWQQRNGDSRCGDVCRRGGFVLCAGIKAGSDGWDWRNFTGNCLGLHRLGYPGSQQTAGSEQTADEGELWQTHGTTSF